MNEKNRKLVTIAALMVMCVIGSVFAYWTQELQAHNEFKTAVYDTTIKERFDSPSDWAPGEETNKDVWIRNDSSIPVFVKVTINQKWIRTADVTDSKGNIISPQTGGSMPLCFSTGNGEEYAAQISWGRDVVLLKSGQKSSIGMGLPLVDQISDATGKWLLVSDEPDTNGDFLCYFIGTIDRESSSPLLIDAVTMNPLIEPSIVEKHTTYNETKKQWETTDVPNNTYGYDSAKYTMTITAHTVQATRAAVRETYTSSKDNAEIVLYLTSFAMD